MTFGSAIHKALEHWYGLPQAEREFQASQKNEAEMLAYGHGLGDERRGALESIRQFVLRARADLKDLPEKDKRSLASGVKILRAYFKTYCNDGYDVLSDADGPMIERNIEFNMCDTPEMRIDYFGTIDVVLKQRDTGAVVIADHKTTSALGSEFFGRVKPNHQYTGYVMAARKVLGLDTRLFMVNGIQVASTKQAFARQITERTDLDFMELEAAVTVQASNWVRALAAGLFPQSAPNPCSMYGGCTFHRVCEVPDTMRESVIGSLWPQA